jgi:hypothetical protein
MSGSTQFARQQRRRAVRMASIAERPWWHHVDRNRGLGDLDAELEQEVEMRWGLVPFWWSKPWRDELAPEEENTQEACLQEEGREAFLSHEWANDIRGGVREATPGWSRTGTA